MSRETRVLGLGAGGHAKVVIDILRRMGGFEIVGLLDPKADLWGEKLLNVPILGGDELLQDLLEEGVRGGFIGLGGVGDTSPRRHLYERARRNGLELVDAIDPAAVVSATAEVGHGPTVMAGAIINAAARLGDNVIVNTSATIEHDCIIGDHVHIATGARLASTVRVGQGAHVGIGASIRQGIRIGANAIVGAGAAVVHDVPDRVVVVGVPARILRKVRT